LIDEAKTNGEENWLVRIDITRFEVSWFGGEDPEMSIRL
jgi:hypothetical protein